MAEGNVMLPMEQQFGEVVNIIIEHRAKALSIVNNEMLESAWAVGAYVSTKLKKEEWGSKVVTQLSEYIRSQHPELKGYSRRSIYNMVLLYDTYSSENFKQIVSQYLSGQFVQPMAAQIPSVLSLTTYSNHIEIICNCKAPEEILFYILYSHKEHLTRREVQRVIATHTYETLLRSKDNMSQGLLKAYPNAPLMFKDTVFVDFLGLPQKHSEAKLKNGLIEKMKQFVLELGKDFLFMEQEYRLNIGASTFKADLLFFHRGLQALVAVELKKTKFHPRDLGQLEFYLEALDRDVKRSNENPSIGIILCPEADRVVVEYAMSRSMSPTMIAEYKRILIPQEKMQQQLREFCQLLLTEEKSKNKKK